jgi:predicted Zn-dependent protease with MMP-like domain
VSFEDVVRRALDEFGHDPALLEDEIRITVLHELAHHFGIDDGRLDELGWS